MQTSNEIENSVPQNIVNLILTLIEREGEYVGGDSFQLVATFDTELLITAELAPDTVLTIEESGTLVWYSYQPFDGDLKVLTFRRGTWVNKLRSNYEEIIKSSDPQSF